MLLCHLKGIWHDELKLKTGFAFAWQNQQLAVCLCAHEESFKTASSCEMYFGFFSSSKGWQSCDPTGDPNQHGKRVKKSPLTNISFKKGGKISCWKISTMFFPQIAIAIGVLTSNRGGGRRTTFAHWTWHQNAIAGCSGRGAIAGCHCSVLWWWGGWRPTLGEWTWCLW